MTATIEAADARVGREPIAEFHFGTFGTRTDGPGLALRDQVVGGTNSSVLLTSVAMIGCLTSTSIGGQLGSQIALFPAGQTVRGELVPDISLAAEHSAATRAPDSMTARSDRQEVAWVKEHSGLTWDQLGKVFGVSRRAVHMWANGGRLNESNARRLRAFAAVIKTLEENLAESSPDGVRARLLQIESDGLNIVDRLRREHASGPTWGSPFGPERLVDTIREPIGKPAGEVAR